jgi:hypothetical protein
MKTHRIFLVGIKTRVSTWSFLLVVHPLRIPIPMYGKKVQVQQDSGKRVPPAHAQQVFSLEPRDIPGTGGVIFQA